MKTIYAYLSRRTFGITFLIIAALLSACETPRVPGLSLSFPVSKPDFVSAKRSSDAVSITPSVDRRAEFIGREVAKSGWLACKTDTLGEGTLPRLVDERLTEAVTSSQIFTAVETKDMQAKMRRSMADSLRLVLREALREVDQVIQKS